MSQRQEQNFKKLLGQVETDSAEQPRNHGRNFRVPGKNLPSSFVGLRTRTYFYQEHLKKKKKGTSEELGRAKPSPENIMQGMDGDGELRKTNSRFQFSNGRTNIMASNCTRGTERNMNLIFKENRKHVQPQTTICDREQIYAVKEKIPTAADLRQS